MSQTITKYYNSSGSSTIVFPTDVSSVKVEGIGGGGAGAYRNATGNGGGGSGGGYAKLNAFSPSANTSYTISVGVGGNTSNNANGTNTTFNSTTLIAKGGVTAGRNNATGQAATSASTGDVVHESGAGANNGTSVGGGGGSSGGNAAAGRAGQVQIGGGNGSDSGNLPAGAGAGGNGAATGNANGSDGVFPGGAGGGSTRTAGNHLGGNGASGQGILTYSTADIDIVATTSTTGSGASVTITNHIVPSGYSHVGLLVGISNFATLDANAPIDTVTFGGVSLSNLVAKAGIATTGQNVSWWYLDSPSASTANIVITPHGSSGGMSATAFTIVNVAGSEADNTNSATQAASSTANVAVTTIADRCTVFSVAELQTGSSGPTPSSPQITLFNPDITDIFSYTNANTPAGNVTHTYSNGAVADNWALAIVSISPFVAAGGVTHLLASMGVGS